MRSVAVALALALLVSTAGHASAQCMQPSGTVIPTGPGCDGGRTTGLLATFACACLEPGVCNVGMRCDPGLPGEDCPDLGMYGTCESRMWHAPNDDPCIPRHHDGLDPVMDCSTMPETFVPTCPLTFTVLTRGTARFLNAFGWYEVTGAAPTADDLHVMLDCRASAGDSVVLDVRSDPSYRGGEIGFFLLTPEDHAARGTCAGGDCCATVERFRSGVGYAYLSQVALNPEGDDFVHLLVYDSRIRERKFYFAWEDTFAAPNNDFTDLVTSVEGVECSGAGADCDTGMMGACGFGVTSCSGGSLSCTPIATAQPEVCNGADDDCDGTPDDGAACGTEEVCDDGRCVPNCLVSDEFVCSGGFTCDGATGRCVETACIGVACDAGEVCRGGSCFAECEGVICPFGQLCLRDQCVDLCDGIGCAAGEVCRGGVCVAGCGACAGITCLGGLVCATAGAECTDPSCATPCAAGTHCAMGTCVDDCAGAICPRGQSCVRGECVSPGGRDAGVSFGDPAPLDGGVAMDAGPGARRGCSCRVGGATGGVLPILVSLLLALAARRR
jgi:hypothetical protein